MNTTTINDTANLDAITTWDDVTTADAALVEVMQWKGTRDALIARTIHNGPAARKALLANLDAFTYRHDPTALRNVEAAASLVATIAALHWLDGDAEAALTHLAIVPEGHRMGDLLKPLVGNGVPAQVWAGMMGTVTEAACLAFADQERARAAAVAGASDAE